MQNQSQACEDAERAVEPDGAAEPGGVSDHCMDHAGGDTLASLEVMNNERRPAHPAGGAPGRRSGALRMNDTLGLLSAMLEQILTAADVLLPSIWTTR